MWLGGCDRHEAPTLPVMGKGLRTTVVFGVLVLAACSSSITGRHAQLTVLRVETAQLADNELTNVKSIRVVRTTWGAIHGYGVSFLRDKSPPNEAIWLFQIKGSCKGCPAKSVVLTGVKQVSPFRSRGFATDPSPHQPPPTQPARPRHRPQVTDRKRDPSVRDSPH